MTHDSFASALNFHLEKRGLSLRELARRTGLPLATPSFWRTGRNSPSQEQAERVAKELGLHAAEADELLSLAALSHVPDKSARASLIDGYYRLNSLEAKVKDLEGRLNSIEPSDLSGRVGGKPRRAK